MNCSKFDCVLVFSCIFSYFRVASGISLFCLQYFWHPTGAPELAPELPLGSSLSSLPSRATSQVALADEDTVTDQNKAHRVLSARRLWARRLSFF